ncbi:hypothetical protein D3C86_810730 [compost metagenome]
MEQGGIHLIVTLYVLLGQDGLTGRDLADERQAVLFWRGLLFLEQQADAAGGAGHDLDDPFLGQGLQMFLGRIGRLEAKLLGDLGASRRHAGLAHVRLDKLQHFSLAGGKGFHSIGTCLFIQHTGSIYSAVAKARRC